MNNLRTSNKLLLAYTLFSMPILYLLFTIYQGKREQIEFTRSEITGAQYIDQLRTAQETLVETGDASAQRAANLIAKADVQFGAGLGASDAAASVVAALRDSKAADFVALRASVQELIGKVADGSNLTLDIDLDSYYVMDAVTGKTPDLIGRLAALASATQNLAAKAKPTVDEEAQVIALEGGLTPVMAGLGASLNSAFKANKDGTTQHALAQPYSAAQDAFKDAATALHQVAFAKQAFDQGKQTSAVEKLSHLGQIGSVELVRLLEARSAHLLRSLLIELSVATGLFVTGVAFALIVIQRGMARPLAALTTTVGCLAKGELSVTIPALDRKDEIGEMSQAIQTLKENAFRARMLERQQAEAQSQRAASDERIRRESEQAASAEAAALVVGSIGKGLERLAARDLTFRLTNTLPQAYEKLCADFNHAAEELCSAMMVVGDNAKTIRSEANELTSASDDLSRRTEQQAANVEEMAASLASITGTVRKTAESAMRASVAVSNTKTNAEQSGDVVRQAVAAMNNIEVSSKKIGQIIGLIDEIATQTNLLALNAGVEAARAGESGRGFAVVANEVRALAQRSAEAAKQIKTLVSSSNRQVDDGVKLVNAAGQSLEWIVSQIAEITIAVSDMANAAKEQANGLHEINAGLTHMDQVTQQNAVMVEQSTAACKSLSNETEGLAELLEQFQIGDDRHEAARQEPSRAVGFQRSKKAAA